MTILTPFKRLLVEDFQTEKNWIGKLIVPLNDYLDNLSAAVKSNLSLRDNIAGQLNTLTVTEIPFEYRWTRADRPLGLIVIAARDVNSAAVGGLSLPAWTTTSSGNIQVTSMPTFSTPPSSSNPYTVTIFTFGG